ncbi:hypothetical protein [Alkalicoccus saliphilus]|nr:hypothetical protein [Alkalicoccus saliphilus]
MRNRSFQAAFSNKETVYLRNGGGRRWEKAQSEDPFPSRRPNS